MSLAIDAKQPVTLIDLDLRSPRIHKLFEILPEVGIDACLFKGAAVPDALFTPGIDLLKVLPTTERCKTVAQVLRSRNLRVLLDSIKASFPDDIILLDLPSVKDSSDGQAFEDLTDALLLVIEDGVTRERDYIRSLDSIDERKLLGTVLNRVATSG